MSQVYGCINANGTMYSGSGDFKVVAEHNDSGEFTIIFNTPFKKVPAVVATQNFPKWNDFTSDGGATTDTVVIIAISQERVKFKTGNSKGEGKDRNFCFIAIGE